MKIAFLLIGVLILNGCMGIGSTTESEKSDTGYYLIDTKKRFFCIGNTSKCWNMTRIVSSRAKLAPIESAYNKKITGPNYPVSLILTIMNPDDKSYKAEAINDEGRYFRIPINKKTRTVKNTLESIDNGMYGSGIY